MIVNLYVDHLMSSPPNSAEEVWNATREHSRLFSEAASRIGLTPGEYGEFRNALLDGKAAYVRLPKRLDAMSGARRGSVYAVRNAIMNKTILGWRVALADGTTVYVPQVCGNISLVHRASIARVPHARPHVAPHRVAAAHLQPAFHKAVAVVPKEVSPPLTPVDVTPPVVAPAEVAVAPVVAAVAPVAGGGGNGFLFFIPAIIGGIFAGVSHGHGVSTPPVAIPPCASGSNALNACQITQSFLR